MSGNAALLQLLKETKVTEIPSVNKQYLIEFGKDDLIRDVNEVLSEKRILSAPVYDHEKDQYLGTIDLRDIVAFVLSLHQTGGPIVFTADKIVDFSGMNTFRPMPSDSTVFDVVKEICVERLHRVPLVKDKRVINLVTQADIVGWIAFNKDRLGAAGDKTVGELEKDLGGIGGLKQLLLSINEEDTVEKAFSIMQKYNIHGVPVLNKEGKLIANISASDMKHIVKFDIEVLKATAKEFLEHIEGGPRPVITCTKSTKFVEVLDQLASSRVHRTYVVDEAGALVDIITLTNVLDTIGALATGSSLNQ